MGLPQRARQGQVWRIASRSTSIICRTSATAVPGGNCGSRRLRYRACHSDSGIHAVQSRLRWMRGDDASFAHAVEWETAKTIEKKLRERDFALLRRDWQ